MAQPSGGTRAMSSGITVRVGNSVNGIVHSVRLASNDLIVDELRDELVHCSDIPVNDQILLGGPPFARLDPRRALSSYGLPASDKLVFLYDRRMIMQEHPVPPRLALEPVDFEMPTTPVATSESSRILSESTSPMIRALAEYETIFQLQFDQSYALERSSIANVSSCEQCVAELRVQADAIAAAIANVELFRGSMTKHFSPFWSDFEAAALQHEQLLGNFETHLAALTTITLHPALVTATRKTLYDCIPVEREREWAKQCEQSHVAMQSQVSRLKQVHDEICGDVSELVKSQDHVSLAYQDATQELTKMKNFVGSLGEITSTLASGLDALHSKISATTSSNEVHAMSKAMLDLCRDLDVLHFGQMDLIPSAQKWAEEIKAQMATLSKVKVSFFGSVHSHLRRISIVQSKIRDFENSLEMLKDALRAQKKQFDELDHLQKLPNAYFACLKEITRRLTYGKKFSNRIQSMAEELAQMRDLEVQFRDAFLHEFGQHLLRDFVPGLAEKPSHCEFRMRPFDQTLPQIEQEEEENESGYDGVKTTTDHDGDEGGSCVTNESKEKEFFESRASDGMPPTSGATATAHAAPASVEAAALLQKRCDELEAKVAELTLELQHTKKGSSYFSESSSLARSDLSKTSMGREDDGSSCDFPLVLALAATAGAMTSSSEADRSNLLERELQSLKNGKEATEAESREKDQRIAKLERENQQYMLNAAAEIQDRTRRESQLEDHQATLQQAVQALQLSVDMQRSGLIKVLKLLDFLPTRPQDLSDPGQFVTSHLDRVEDRIKELRASADSEQALRRELARQNDEISLLESQHLDVNVGSGGGASGSNDSFKISFRSFTCSDLALFLPTSVPGSDAQRVYLAFHHGCPHRFLSEESISSFMVGGRKYPDYVVGRIVFIDEQVASDAHNPFGLQIGTTFYILTVESLQDT